MGERFLRVVSDLEWRAIAKNRRIAPTPLDDWYPYGADEVVFLHRTTVPWQFVLSYADRYFGAGAPAVHLIVVELPLRSARNIEQDASCTYEHAVVHRGAIEAEPDLRIEQIATFHPPSGRGV